jgi:hypothetical protein
VDSDIIEQLLIRYSALIKYSRKYVSTFILQGEAYDHAHLPVGRQFAWKCPEMWVAMDGLLLLDNAQVQPRMAFSCLTMLRHSQGWLALA